MGPVPHTEYQKCHLLVCQANLTAAFEVLAVLGATKEQIRERIEAAWQQANGYRDRTDKLLAT